MAVACEARRRRLRSIVDVIGIRLSFFVGSEVSSPAAINFGRTTLALARAPRAWGQGEGNFRATSPLFIHTLIVLHVTPYMAHVMHQCSIQSTFP